MLNSSQVRMARAALGWGVRDLAQKADVNVNTVTRIEKGGKATIGVLTRVQDALESAGIVFLEPGQIKGDGYGVRVLPNIDGWLVNLDEGWARNERLLVSVHHADDGSMQACGATPLTEPMTHDEYAELVGKAMAAVNGALRQRGGRISRLPPELERQVKLRRLREAVAESERSGIVPDASVRSIIEELDREDPPG